MNKVERLVYDFVKSNPRLKKRVRDIYQGVCDLMPVVRNRSAYPVDVREGYFFGFHDKCPWSADDQYLLAHRGLIPLRMPRAGDELEVGYFDELGQKKFHPVGRTRTWNWHQGAQLQWLGETETIVFNDFDGTQNVARMMDLAGGVIRVLSRPVAALTPDGSKALSYSFARLRGSPYAYAYAHGVDAEADRLIPQEDGLWVVDTRSDEVHRLFTVQEISRIQPEASMQGAFHHFTHCQVAPSGRRFKFFHRWIADGNQQWTRMFTADMDGGNLHLIPTNGMVSHVCWSGSDRLIAYASTSAHGDAYYEFQDRTYEARVLGRDCLRADGHPAISSDCQWMLTDTYADRFRRRFLMLYHLERQQRHDLAMFYSPKTFAGATVADHLQCDFHPRWSRDNRQICFDSAHTGVRALCVMNVGSLGDGAPKTI